MKIWVGLIPILLVIGVIPVFAVNEFVSIPGGTSIPGCEEINECFSPYEVIIDVGDTVTWSNDDTAAHTVTSGSAVDGPSGVFDSSLFMAQSTFAHTFDGSGTFPYFCMVHPWMDGIIIVQEAENIIDFTTDKSLYHKGDQLTISGNVSYDSEIPFVTIQIFTPGKTNFANFSTIPVNTDGSFLSEFNVGGPTWTSDGIYPIKVTYNNKSLEKSIEFQESNQEEGLIITMEGVEIAGIGKTITIIVSGASGTVEFEIIASDGEIIETLSFVASDFGDINLPWIIPKETTSGIYTISARDAFNSGCVRFDLDTFVTDNNCISEPNSIPLTVNTDLPSYDRGDTIIISGFVKELAEYSQSITILVLSPLQNIMSISQVIPNSDGSYSTSVIASKLTYDGTYEVRAQYGSQKITNTFVYYGGISESENNLSDKAIKMFEKKIDRWNNTIEKLTVRVDKLESKGNLERADEIRAKILVFESVVKHLESLIH